MAAGLISTERSVSVDPGPDNEGLTEVYELARVPQPSIPVVRPPSAPNALVVRESCPVDLGTGRRQLGHHSPSSADGSFSHYGGSDGVGTQGAAGY